LLVLVALLLAGCAASPPSRPADITGIVTRVTAGSGGTQFLVEENPADAAGSAKASVRTDGNTHWFSGGTTFDPTQLKQGMRVSVWFDGPVATSYPVQAKGSDIVVLATSAP
jgi:beta-N-acetylhexosaminidase